MTGRDESGVEWSGSESEGESDTSREMVPFDGIADFFVQRLLCERQKSQKPCQHHDVDDLRAPEHRLDEAGVPRAVHQRELQLVVRQVREVVWESGHEGGEAEVQRDAARRALRVLVQRRRGEVRGQSAGCNNVCGMTRWGAMGVC